MEAWTYQFPDATKRAEEELGFPDVELEVRRIKVEVDEALKAVSNEPDLNVVSELMDVIHTAETAIRMMDVPVQVLCKVKQGVIRKNAERGYYR